MSLCYSGDVNCKALVVYINFTAYILNSVMSQQAEQYNLAHILRGKFNYLYNNIKFL